MKFIEFGIGNSWLVRTEIELEDGTEYEEKVIKGPIEFQSIYVRIWTGKIVFILDSKDGYKRSRKDRAKIKVIIGIVSN